MHNTNSILVCQRFDLSANVNYQSWWRFKLRGWNVHKTSALFWLCICNLL